MRNPKILVLERGEALAEQVERVAAELRPRPDVVSCTRLAEAGDVLTTQGPFEVLVAGPSLCTRTGLSRLEIIHDEIPSLAIILAFPRNPEAPLRMVVRTGAVDLVKVPVADAALTESLDRALAMGRQLVSAGAPTAGPAPAPTGPGQVFTTASATGGCGKTFYATNLAYFLAHHTDKRVCIVDLDLQFGEVSTALRLRPKYTVYDALHREEGDERDHLQTHLEEYLTMHETGVWVLPAPKDPAEADRITPPDVTRVIEAVRQRFDYVVVDTPAALTEVVLAAFDLSDLLYCMATLDLPSVRNMGVFLNTLEKLKIPADNIRLVLNKAESDVGIDVSQITRLFPQGFRSVLPYAKEVSRSINVGMPVLVSSPSSDVSRRLAAGMVEVLPEENRRRAEETNAAVAGGLLGRLFRRATTPAFTPGAGR